MQTRLCPLQNKNTLINGLALEPVIIKKQPYLSLFPEQKKVICSALNNTSPQIRKENGVLVGPIRQMNNCEVLKKNVFTFDYNSNCDNDLLIKFGKPNKKKF